VHAPGLRADFRRRAWCAYVAGGQIDP
jgi:hypothetical protein